MTERKRQGRPRREDRRVGLHIEISETAHKALAIANRAYIRFAN